MKRALSILAAAMLVFSMGSVAYAEDVPEGVRQYVTENTPQEDDASEAIMNRFFHRTKRACALLLAVITLASFAVPASAFDDLSEVVNVTDYGTTEVPETPPSDISEVPEEEPDTNLSDSQQPDTGEEEKPSDPSSDATEPPVKDTGETPEPGQGEDLPAEPDQALPNEPTVGMSGLDPPDGFSFEFVRDSGSGTGRRMARASSTSTMYMEKLPGLTHYFPFDILRKGRWSFVSGRYSQRACSLALRTDFRRSGVYGGLPAEHLLSGFGLL